MRESQSQVSGSLGGKPRPDPRSLFGKGDNKQTQPSSTSATAKSVPGQAKVNLASVSVQCDTPVTYLPRARLADRIPKLTFPHPKVYAEVNRVAKEIAERDAKLLSSERFDAADVSVERSTSSVAFVDTGLSNDDHLNAVNQCDDVIGGDVDVNKQSDTEEITNSGHETCDRLGDDIETSFPRTIYLL